MRQRYPLPWALLLLLCAACTRGALPTAPPSGGRYVIDGRVVIVPATVIVSSGAVVGDPDRPDELIVMVGRPPRLPGEAALMLSFFKPRGASASAYRVNSLSHTVQLMGAYNATSYSTKLTATLKRTRSGGYTGTFSGTQPSAEAGEPASTITGTFTDVHP